MAVSIGVDRASLAAIRKALEMHGGERLADRLAPVMKASVRRIRDTAREIVQRRRLIRTGTLLRAIKTGSFRRKRRGAVLHAAVGIDKDVVGTFTGRGGRSRTARPVKYAHLVEFGFTHHTGRHVAARPFMRLAWRIHRDRTRREIRDAIGRFIAR